MIVKIENGIVTVGTYGLLPGTYPIKCLSIAELARERDILQIKILYARKVEPTKKEITEIAELNKLISQLTELIVEKCGGDARKNRKAGINGMER